MRRTAAIALLMLGAVANATDFRDMNFGDECRNIRDLEERAGSTFASAEEHLYIFRGAYQGWPTTIAYWCLEGRFRRGVYLFDYTSLDEAVEFYRVLKRQLVVSHGSPNHDGESPDFRRKIEEATGRKLSAVDIYSCMWEREGTQVLLSTSGPYGGEGWRVSVNFESKGI